MKSSASCMRSCSQRGERREGGEEGGREGGRGRADVMKGEETQGEGGEVNKGMERGEKCYVALSRAPLPPPCLRPGPGGGTRR